MKTKNLKTYAIYLMALCAMPQLHAATKFFAAFGLFRSGDNKVTYNSNSRYRVPTNRYSGKRLKTRGSFPKNDAELTKEVSELSEDQKKFYLKIYEIDASEYKKKKQPNQHQDAQDKKNTDKNKKGDSQTNEYPTFDPYSGDTMTFG